MILVVFYLLEIFCLKTFKIHFRPYSSLLKYIFSSYYLFIRIFYFVLYKAGLKKYIYFFLLSPFLLLLSTLSWNSQCLKFMTTFINYYSCQRIFACFHCMKISSRKINKWLCIYCSNMHSYQVHQSLDIGASI